MGGLICKHCGGELQLGDKTCHHCGIPLPENFGRSPQRRFVLFFTGLVIFCIVVMIWLPPDWTRLIK